MHSCTCINRCTYTYAHVFVYLQLYQHKLVLITGACMEVETDVHMPVDAFYSAVSKESSRGTARSASPSCAAKKRVAA